MSCSDDEHQHFFSLLRANAPDPSGFKFVNLEVTVQCGTPIILTFPWLNFDALVIHLFLKKILGNDFYLIPGKDPFLFQDAITPPIARDERGFFRTSVSHLENYKRNMTVIYGRFHSRDLELMDPGRASKINIQSGHFKSAAIKFVYFSAQTVKFWCVGDERWLRELLDDLTFLGKKGAMGFGSVEGVTVEEIDDDFSCERADKLTRPIPARFLSHCTRVMSVPWYPPYWAKNTAEVCGIPFVPGRLKK